MTTGIMQSPTIRNIIREEEIPLVVLAGYVNMPLGMVEAWVNDSVPMSRLARELLTTAIAAIRRDRIPKAVLEGSGGFDDDDMPF